MPRGPNTRRHRAPLSSRSLVLRLLGGVAMFVGLGVAFSSRYCLGYTDPHKPLSVPLSADLAGFPPLLIHVGADEGLRDDSTRLAERAGTASVRVELKIWPVVPHAWQLV